MSSEATPDASQAQEQAQEKSTQPNYGLKGPGFPLQDQEVTCPSCGRFAGTYERCPFCGANMVTRLSVRLLRRISLLVAFGGLALTWWAARNMEVPLRKVGDFSPTMNFAILRVHGEIVAGPYYGDRGDSFYVGIDDGSGRINVKAYGKMTSALQALELGRGDRVEARGSIRLQAGKAPGMSLRIPDDLKLLTRAEAPPPTRSDEIVEISSVNEEMAGERVRIRVRGVLSGFRENAVGREVTLNDGTGKLKIWVYKSDLEQLGAGKDLLANDQFVEVVGRLDLYRRKGGQASIQLRPFKAPDAVAPASGDRPEIASEASKPRSTPDPTPPKPAPESVKRPEAVIVPPAPEVPVVAPPQPPAPAPAPAPPVQVPIQGQDLGKVLQGALKGVIQKAVEEKLPEILPTKVPLPSGPPEPQVPVVPVAPETETSP